MDLGVFVGGTAHEAFNVVSGDVFRWRWMRLKLVAYFGTERETTSFNDGHAVGIKANSTTANDGLQTENAAVDGLG